MVTNINDESLSTEIFLGYFLLARIENRNINKCKMHRERFVSLGTDLLLRFWPNYVELPKESSDIIFKIDGLRISILLSDNINRSQLIWER